MDVGYVLGPQDQYEELRYSLRSLANFPHERVWIAGAAPPEWSTGLRHIPVDHIPLDRENRPTEWWYDRKLNIRNNLLALCEHPDVSDTFLYMNDDFFLLEPYTDQSPIPTRGTMREFAAGDITNPAENNGPIPDAYKYLVDKGVADPLLVSEHVPLLVDKERLAVLMGEVWDSPGFHYASIWGNLERPELMVDWGKKDGDPLLSQGKGYRDEWPDFWTTVSTTHIPFWEWPVGEKLRALFPTPSPYEA